MAQRLSGSKIAILATDGLRPSDLAEWLDELAQEGAEVDVVGPDARAENYDAIVLSGAAAKPDQLRVVEESMGFVRDFFDARKPTAVICHGPWTMIEAGSDMVVGPAAWPSFNTVDQGFIDWPEFDNRPVN